MSSGRSRADAIATAARAVCSTLLVLPLLATSCRDRAEPGARDGAGSPPAAAPVPAAEDPRPVLPIETVVIDGQTFHLELAATPEIRQRGLMFRPEIPHDGGMLFAFPYAEVQEFWMGHCLVDIDVIYLDPRGRVTATHHMPAEPLKRPTETEEEYAERMPSYSSRLPAQFVIELQGGRLDDLDVSLGETIAIDTRALADLAR